MAKLVDEMVDELNETEKWNRKKNDKFIRLKSLWTSCDIIYPINEYQYHSLSVITVLNWSVDSDYYCSVSLQHFLFVCNSVFFNSFIFDSFQFIFRTFLSKKRDREGKLNVKNWYRQFCSNRICDYESIWVFALYVQQTNLIWVFVESGKSVEFSQCLFSFLESFFLDYDNKRATWHEKKCVRRICSEERQCA